MLEIIETELDGVRILKTPVYRDPRGYFHEAFQSEVYAAAGVEVDWKQDNVSVSKKNVIRGLHYQVEHPQAKLVRVAHGEVVDVVVDIRRSSPTLGRHVAIRLAAGDGQALLIPVGFAHGFAVLEEDTVFLYKVSDSYSPQGERTIRWNDSELGIEWPIPSDMAIVSDKDRRGCAFKDADLFP